MPNTFTADDILTLLILPEKKLYQYFNVSPLKLQLQRPERKESENGCFQHYLGLLSRQPTGIPNH
jgi:hypothetical protein